MIKVTDEMLMSLADGELEEFIAVEVARAAEADPVLAMRLNEFKRTRNLAKAAYADILQERVPERLSTAARRPRRLLAGWRDWRVPLLPVGIAVAASIAGFALALAVMWAGPGSSFLPTQDQIALVLDSAASGEKMALADNRSIEPTATYVTLERVCRSFRVTGTTADAVAWLGVACRDDDKWQLEMAVAEGIPGSSDFAPASDRATQSVDTFLDAAGAGESLDDQTEKRLRLNGWRMER